MELLCLHWTEFAESALSLPFLRFATKSQIAKECLCVTQKGYQTSVWYAGQHQGYLQQHRCHKEHCQCNGEGQELGKRHRKGSLEQFEEKEARWGLHGSDFNPDHFGEDGVDATTLLCGPVNCPLGHQRAWLQQLQSPLCPDPHSVHFQPLWRMLSQTVTMVKAVNNRSTVKVFSKKRIFAVDNLHDCSNNR